VLGAVFWVQSHRPDLEAELAPPLREARWGVINRFAVDPPLWLECAHL